MSIEATHISKSFGTFAALHDVSLRVNTGELVALLGPSGSGKTTLLRIIAGLESPDPGQGTVRFGGQDVTAADVGRRGVGFVFQHYALFRNMTVFKNVAFGLQVRPRSQRPGRKEIRDRVLQLLRLVQLEGLANRHPSQLSGGQRQRVALARALAVEPKVLLLDEPFGALDAKVRRELRKWLRELHDKVHVTSVFVTHDQEEALEVADRVVVMNKGRVEQDGTPADVFHHPANPFVMDFMGNVNLFHGRIEGDRAVFGPLVVDRPQSASSDGAAQLYVRPHDLEIRRHHDGTDGTPVLPARVARVQAAGSSVKLELVGDGGQTFYADLSHERFRDLDIGPDADVFVAVRQSRVFTDGDYSI